MIKHLSVVCFILTIGYTLSGQTSPMSQMDGEIAVISNNLDVDGSPLMYDDWQSATLIDLQGKRLEDALVNYDGLRNKFISPHSDNKVIEVNSFHYREVILNSDSTRFVNGSPYGILGFTRVIFEGEKFLLLEKFSSVKRTKDKDNYASVTAMYKIKNSTNLYVFTEAQGLTEVSRKHKDFEKVFGLSGLKAFVKKGKLKLKDDNDLEKLMAHCHSKL